LWALHFPYLPICSLPFILTVTGLHTTYTTLTPDAWPGQADLCLQLLAPRARPELVDVLTFCQLLLEHLLAPEIHTDTHGTYRDIKKYPSSHPSSQPQGLNGGMAFGRTRG